MVLSTMGSLAILLLLSHAAYFLSANSLEPRDCISAEQLCVNFPQCHSSYNVIKNCSRADAVISVNASECQEAARAIFQSPLLHCKCQRRMKKEELCLNIFWTVHPDYAHGYLDLYTSPYKDNEQDTMKELDNIHSDLLPSESVQSGASINHCLEEANICSKSRKCSQYKNSYVVHCSNTNADGSCDRQRCHEHLRIFFKRVPMAFTKRFLFCPCNQESNCSERRRQNIVPNCSFEEKYKKNCLQLYGSCMRDNICKSRLLDYRTQCHLFDKKRGSCPPEQHDRCILSYMGMIGTVMTPNFISNSSMDMSIWCTCEGSSNQQEECKNILGMFTSNRCLHNAISKEGAELTIPTDDDEGTGVSVLPGSDQESHRNSLSVFPASSKLPTNTASGVSSPSLAWTLLNPTLFLWFLKVF
ncbi:GDNF family receptor alpha-3 [Pseudophryne corroboree]|uniref:GDNF family receptor alpha-3 n=1 Tax=Pseudophryne corroboree TaxID=495146 RepID=UPI003081D230